MLVKLETQKVIACIKSLGAELCSLQLKQNGTEYIWQADPGYWGRHAPVLFPIVGQLINNQYELDGQTYQLSQHGFARDMEFEIVLQNSQKAVFRLLFNSKTLEKYPGKFELFIIYTLQDDVLSIEYKVINQDDKTIYFSIGAHPAFRCPLGAGERWEDYYLKFSAQETTVRYLLHKGLLSGECEEILQDSDTLPLTAELFRQDAIILKNLKSKSVALKSQKSDKVIQIDFARFPYLGIWSRPNGGAPFICIEPWYGVSDNRNERKIFKDKEGMQRLEMGEEFCCQYSIKIS
ncbi:aldose 1-epimerase family protein [Propionispora vibrioides]|uniref:Galactose mutarotase n=1 Tax=Propionispora vibrioides TaxID=112903 RepID=A0A1H8T6L9_9FIRM|nr:aldose 1-epimerase family protein [Propionispora vibrioides]SEO86532.1 Galactose mutarotase [Propionispora vibrioides]